MGKSGRRRGFRVRKVKVFFWVRWRKSFTNNNDSVFFWRLKSLGLDELDPEKTHDGEIKEKRKISIMAPWDIEMEVMCWPWFKLSSQILIGVIVLAGFKLWSWISVLHTNIRITSLTQHEWLHDRPCRGTFDTGLIHHIGDASREYACPGMMIWINLILLLGFNWAESYKF